MNVNEIEKRQNEDQMLQYQYAARHYYNRAEKQNKLVWFFCVLSWLPILLPDIPECRVYFLALSFVLIIAAFCTNQLMTKNVVFASSLRKYFDTYVFKLNVDRFKKSEIQRLEELSVKAINRSPKEGQIQMSNTGYDSPPGVRNWYECPHSLSEHDAIFQCQKENCWWNNKIFRKRILYYIAEASILIILAIIFAIQTMSSAEFIQIILCSSGLLLKGIERIHANWEYYNQSQKIDGVLALPENCRSTESMQYLQDMIDKRRAMPVLERNNIHKHYANILSKLYHDIIIGHNSKDQLNKKQ